MAISTVKEIIKEEPGFCKFMDLASERLGGNVLFATDDFFAEKENLIKPGRGIFIAEKYTDRGKWMDGWESRRKRTSGHDWAVIQLAAPGKIKGVDIDTNFFLGNHPPFASVEAARLNEDVMDWETVDWKEILTRSHLDAGSRNFFDINSDEVFTHLRLHIYPDGGVARFRVYGEVYKDWSVLDVNEKIDLAAAINGAKSIACNDMFFSSMDNLLMPGRGINMGDGWETKRNRTPGNRDWVKIRLATKGVVDSMLIDTFHFKGNYPDSCLVEGCMSDNDEAVLKDKVEWKVILPSQKLSADNEHVYNEQIEFKGPVTHIRLNIFPDGGISRLRLIGTKAF